MTCVGVTSDHAIGPYFFSELMNTASNLAVLETWLGPQLGERGLTDDMLPQCNGTRTYFAVSVHSILNECFASHWTDQGLTTFLAPLA
jgi:hypothetical protein